MRSLQWRLFLGYILVILLAVSIVGGAAQHFAASHLAEFFHHFHQIGHGHYFLHTINRALMIASAVAIGVAGLLSAGLAWSIAAPIRALNRATQYIADGDYAVRVSEQGTQELRALATAFNRLGAQLESAERKRQQLLADVIHELSTPLTSLQGVFEGIRDGVFAADSETLTRMTAETRRLRRLVNDLTQMIGGDAGTPPLIVQECAITEVVTNSVQAALPLFLSRVITLAYPRSLLQPYVLGDPERLMQVFTNLLVNAAQYTPRQGMVTVSVTQETTHVAVTITDTGVGIAPEDLPHIFDRSYRADRSHCRATGGSGIGLTIVREIVELHGGQVTALSEINRGSQFTVRLPLLPRDDTVIEGSAGPS